MCAPNIRDPMYVKNPRQNQSKKSTVSREQQKLIHQFNWIERPPSSPVGRALESHKRPITYNDIYRQLHQARAKYTYLLNHT